MANTGDMIYTKLSGDGTISASVGTRISPQWVQENSALPYISYTLVSGNPIMVKNEDSFQDKELWQITVFDDVYDTAKTLAARARIVLEGFSGTSASVVVKNIVYEGSFEASDGKVFQVSNDYEVNRVV